MHHIIQVPRRIRLYNVESILTGLGIRIVIQHQGLLSLGTSPQEYSSSKRFLDSEGIITTRLEQNQTVHFIATEQFLTSGLGVRLNA